MFNIGIIGCGKIAQVRHIPEYADHPQAKLAGFFDLNQDRAQALAEQWGGKAYSSWEELLADPAIDAVSVCVANNAHAQISIAALKAGKHVLCEKPMATTLEDCEAMVAAARESGKFLMIGQNQRLTKAHQKARQLVAEDTITLQARQRANEMMQQAEERSRELKRSANEYCEDALRRTEEAVAEAYDEIKKSRARFRALAGGGAPAGRQPYDVEAE